MLRPALRWFVFLSLVAWLPAAAAPGGADVYLFWRSGCPHCEREIAFLKKLEAEQPALRVRYFNVWAGAGQRALLRRVGVALKSDVSAVPFTVVGDQVWVGYLDDRTTGAQIRQRALECLAGACPDSVRGLLAGSDVASGPPPNAGAARADIPETVWLPLLGEVAVKGLSLPVLTVVLAALDGFNPCAMWVLVLLIGVLLGLPDRRRRWLLGSAFLVVSAAVYFVFLAAWLNLFLFLGLTLWVRLAVGAAALAGGGYYLREYVLNRAAVCKVTAPAERRQVFDRLRELASRRSLPLALGGIVLLAFAVNLVELLCSAGLPAVYTHVLTLSDLPRWQYYGYLLLYVFVFLLDDLLVFAVAMTTLEVTGLSAKYTRYAQLVGGVVLVVLGALLLLRPEWLMFG